MSKAARRPNHLQGETSPYLLQHLHNPVDWHPWGPEALEKAKREDKPIFLSIGYSACHWCHVMEAESFENEEIAAILNEHFVCIKVDREERPDLDDIYMSAVQLMSGQGGWPMSVWLTPGKKPFFGGTYFPPEDRYGRPGFPRLLRQIAEVWTTRRGEIEAGADRVRDRIASFGRVGEGTGLLTPGLLEAGVHSMLRGHDPRHGGFGGPPKFPHSMGIQLLLRWWKRTGDQEALNAAALTLDRMALGGIYDHLGGGFHRYSVDARWLVPHFEKMLYDEALLTLAYLEAFQVTGSALYKRVVEETLDYVLREMTSPEGGFYATQDADSEGEEGKFYVWTPEEVHALLGEENGALFCRAYDVDEGGNFEGCSILHPAATAESLAAAVGRAPTEVAAILEEGRRRLLDARASRVPPARDEKVITAWNGFMISSLARSGAVLGEPRYTQAASRAAEFILSRLRSEGRLLRVYKDGRARFPAYLEDHAALLNALVDLYEADFESRWLVEAGDLAALLRSDFQDSGGGGFFSTTEAHDDLLVRIKNAQDGSTPSGNSLAAYGLLRLGHLTGDRTFEAMAEGCLRAFQPLLEQAPAAFHQMLLALDLFLGPRSEIVIAGPSADPGTQALLSAVRGRFLPRAVVAWTEGTPGGVGGGRSPGGKEALPPEDPSRRAEPSLTDETTKPERLAGPADTRPPDAVAAGILEGKTVIDGRPAAYVCRDFTCDAPVISVEALTAALEAAS